MMVKNRNGPRKPFPQQNMAYPVDQEPVIVQPGSQPAQFLQQPQLAPPQQSRMFGSEASFPIQPGAPRYPGPLLPRSSAQSTYESDVLLANLTGWSMADIDRLRREFAIYSTPYGVIDREGFRKLFVSSLLNMPWDAVERESEGAFRSFDVNQTGTLDFNEYITACTRLIRSANPPPSMYPPYN